MAATRFHATALTLLALAAGGCVQRMISITSDPPGALAYLNDNEVGRTPVVVPFTFYGVYDVRLEHDGYQPLITKHEAKMPWWEFPGPDLVAEALSHKKVRFDWRFTMQPLSPLDEAALIDRAAQLRATFPATQPQTQPATRPATRPGKK